MTGPRDDPTADHRTADGVLHRYDPARDSWYHPDPDRPACDDPACPGNSPRRPVLPAVDLAQLLKVEVRLRADPADPVDPADVWFLLDLVDRLRTELDVAYATVATTLTTAVNALHVARSNRPTPVDDPPVGDATTDGCACPRVRVGGHVTETRNWSSTCPTHGVGTPWYGG